LILSLKWVTELGLMLTDISANAALQLIECAFQLLIV
jgi:hypothetical protein